VTVVEYFSARIPRGYIHHSRISGRRHGKAIDRLVIASLERVFGSAKEISAMPPLAAALYPSFGSVHVRRNSDPAGITSRNIQNGLCWRSHIGFMV